MCIIFTCAIGRKENRCLNGWRKLILCLSRTTCLWGTNINFIKKFNVFNLPMVLLASVTPFIIIIPMGWNEPIIPLFVICFGSIVVAIGCWYTRLLLFKNNQ